MNRNLVKTLDFIVDSGRKFATGQLPYTIALRREVVAQVIAGLDLDADRARELEARAIPRLSFAPPDKFTLRLIQSLSEVIR